MMDGSVPGFGELPTAQISLGEAAESEILLIVTVVGLRNENHDPTVAAVAGREVIMRNNSATGRNGIYRFIFLSDGMGILLISAIEIPNKLTKARNGHPLSRATWPITLTVWKSVLVVVDRILDVMT